MSYYPHEPFWVQKNRRNKLAEKNMKKHEPTKGPSVIVEEKPVKKERVRGVTVKPLGLPEQFDVPEPLMKHEQWRFKTREFRYEIRRDHTKKQGWFILTEEVADILADYLKDKKTLEVASGTGYMANHLRQRGVEDYTAVDLYINYWEAGSPNYGSIVGDAFDHLNTDYDVVVMGWPPYADPFGKKVVKEMRGGQTLILQGEPWGGCTGTDQMFDLLGVHFTIDEELTEKLNDKHIQFDGIHDWWTVYHHKGPKAVRK